MSDKLRIDLDDNTSPGLQKMEGNLGDVAQAADKAERQLNEAGAASKKLGDTGSKSAVDWSSKITALNQGFELLAKGAEIAFATINTLAEDGSPAFVRLNEKIAETRENLLKLADDPAIQQLADSLAKEIDGNLLPSLKEVPGTLRDWTYTAETTRLRFLEFFGVVAKGTTDSVTSAIDVANAFKNTADEIIAAQREVINVDEKLASIRSKLAEESNLRNISQITNADELKSLIDEETEAMRRQERAQTATAKTREESYRRIELAERRLLDLPRLATDAAKRAADEASRAAEQLGKDREKAAQDAADAEVKYRQEVEKAADAMMAERSKQLQAILDRTEKAKAELVALIEKTQGADGKNVVDAARGQLTPEQVRAQLVKQAQQQARANLLPTGDDPRTFEAQRRAAAKQAGVQAFRDFNTGKTSQADIAGAQNALLQQQASQANSRGQLDTNLVQAMNQALQNQQQLTAQQETQAQQVKQLTAAFAQVGGSARNLNAASRRGLLGN